MRKKKKKRKEKLFHSVTFLCFGNLCCCRFSFLLLFLLFSLIFLFCCCCYFISAFLLSGMKLQKNKSSDRNEMRLARNLANPYFSCYIYGCFCCRYFGERFFIWSIGNFSKNKNPNQNNFSSWFSPKKKKTRKKKNYLTTQLSLSIEIFHFPNSSYSFSDSKTHIYIKFSNHKII